jgi:hypothetical protein
MTRRSWHGADMADPNSEAPAATRPSPTEIPPSVVTEVGCQSPNRRRRRSATARGRFLEMQKWAEVAEKSGSREWARSMPSDAFRTGAHVRLAPVRIWHPETNEQRHEQSPAAVRMPPEPSRSSQFYCRENLLTALQSGSTRHGPRSGGPIQTAPGSA